MTLELFLGVIMLAVVVYASWALYTVFRSTFRPDRDDILEEVTDEARYINAMRRL